MSACTATVTVAGIGALACEASAGHQAHHYATLPAEDKWAAVMWFGDTAIITPPGTRRPRP